MDFGASKRSQILNPKLKTEKVVTESRREPESESAGGYGGPNIGK